MEKKENKSNYLVQGTILAVASIIARVIGMIYRIPLTNILGDEGKRLLHHCQSDLYDPVNDFRLSACLLPFPNWFPNGFTRGSIKMHRKYSVVPCDSLS